MMNRDGAFTMWYSIHITITSFITMVPENVSTKQFAISHYATGAVYKSKQNGLQNILVITPLLRDV